ncbi:PAS domain-containing protein [uncultured Fretibacterium sp.]|uniref:PAS domain-containing protein n=1 Tax=uncultured Fretibacterium sp. TaxID=1678694 RepID=UPI0026231E6A|nr:PAS domain-containing protein [uncultured Fretibacterium sp.]
MQINRETQAIIDSLSDPVLVISSKMRRILACNAAFVHELGFLDENIKGRSFIRIPQLTRPIRHGLLELYFRAKRSRDDKTPFVFQFADPQGSLKTISATVDILIFDGEEFILAYLHIVLPTDIALSHQAEDIAAFNAFADMTQEPWLEFRPRSQDVSMLFNEEAQLVTLGQEFVVHKASKAARKLFGQDVTGLGLSDFPLKGKSFMSFFYREEAALRFLDMLSKVGQLQAPTTLVGESGEALEVEMSCSVHFGTEDTITALYCIPRRIEQDRDLIVQHSVSGQEQDFIFSQPFLGLGRMVPLQPLVRPHPTNADTVLNGYLNDILLTNINDALVEFYGVEKNALLMQSMPFLFPNRSAAVQVLRELFVTRQSSFATYREDTGELLRIALFKAVFNDADHMTRIFLAVSPQVYGLPERRETRKLRSVPSFI